MFVTGKSFQTGVMYHSKLVGPFVSYEEKEVCEYDASRLNEPLGAYLIAMAKALAPVFRLERHVSQTR